MNHKTCLGNQEVHHNFLPFGETQCLHQVNKIPDSGSGFKWDYRKSQTFTEITLLCPFKKNLGSSSPFLQIFSNTTLYPCPALSITEELSTSDPQSKGKIVL